jgi:hypothetical protein
MLQHLSSFLRTVQVEVTTLHGTMNTLWWSPIGMFYFLKLADIRYHDEYQYLIDTQFLTWTNPTGAEPVPSKFDRNMTCGTYPDF